MKKNSQVPSLWTYLNPKGNHFSLKVSTATQDSSTLKKASFPFQTLTESDPLARLLEARFITDAGSTVKKVFLLVQRDRYLLTRDDLWPLNNKDIYSWWQKAFSFHAAKKEEGSFIVLQRVNHEEEPQPWPPLFYCTARELYFPPLCPHCGLALQQCEEDAVLLGAGLRAYSTSWQRYLFCPSCFNGGKSAFYAYAVDKFDPPHLKDRFHLIQEFGKLDKSFLPADPFPCLDCPDRPDCYGPNLSALSRIVPFSFYPFFMFIFEAMSLNAKEFLPLLSGAAFDEMQTQLQNVRELGRIGCLKSFQQDSSSKALTLFEGNERYFLEVLYLKLSFLNGVLQSLFSEGGFYENPHLRFSVDRIWVKLAAAENFLPPLWNFKIRLMDIHRNCRENQAFPKLPPADGLTFLGQLWFYAFLVNKKQNISDVYSALSKIADRTFSGETASISQASPVFFPENIFWNPEGKTTKETYPPLWEKALRLGFSLMQFSWKQNVTWSPEVFSKELTALREEVKARLFREGAAQEEKEERSALPDHQGLLKILEKLQGKWQTEAEEAEPDREEFVETILLAPEGDKKDPLIKEETPETVMLSPGPISHEPLSVRRQERREEDAPETVILSPSRAKGTEEPPETVIVSPSKTPRGSGGISVAPIREASTAPEAVKEELPEEDLSATVILSPKDLRDKKGKYGNRR